MTDDVDRIARDARGLVEGVRRQIATQAQHLVGAEIECGCRRHLSEKSINVPTLATELEEYTFLRVNSGRS
ncbi:hypothetical protein [Haloarcula pellucida]|uniref:hypothetical protein n=1 Tax=Haloarcula pellucida TaxID=1427151 RepID=UPI00166816D0|nr:hypothetical protein [Halomicroarcula pellucida]MBX0347135.1 hypothetical protein [Halomicroarcula pellucida]